MTNILYPVSRGGTAALAGDDGAFNAVRTLRERMAANAAVPAVVLADREVTFLELLERVDNFRALFDGLGIGRGSVVALDGDFAPDPIAAFIALAELRAIIVALSPATVAQRATYVRIAEVTHEVTFAAGRPPRVGALGGSGEHAIYDELRGRGSPGLVVFTSGSSGTPKAAVHDLARLLEKFAKPRRALRTIPFLLFDHLGGINTMLHVLCNGGALVPMSNRAPDAVLAAIARHRVELLPASPSFLNLVLATGAFDRHDLSSLQLITYGTEVMPASTLAALAGRLPGVRFQQTYGLTEVGVLQTKSRDSASVWVELGGNGVETRIVDGMLEIKSRSQMLGYLNAPSPLSEDGWLKTFDAVEVDGPYVRILGRRSELINVGGQKVYPAEVESVLSVHPEVEFVTVRGAPNALLGAVVTAEIKTRSWPISHEEIAALRARLRAFCRERLPTFAVPQRIEIVAEARVSERYKRLRKPVTEEAREHAI